MHIVILTRQIGHYHNARFKALSARHGALTIMSVSNEGHFKGFVNDGEEPYNVVRLYDGNAEYLRATQNKNVDRDICAALDRENPDVIAVAGWASPESFAAIKWARQQGCAVIMMSDSQAEDASRNAWREAIKKRIVKLTDAGFVAGHSHADYLQSLGMPADHISLGYDVVDNEHFIAGADRARGDADSVRRHHGLPSRYILASGRFIEKKNFERLIRAYAQARAKVADPADLLILGGGPLQPELDRLATDAPGVHLYGFAPYQDLPVLYGLADAFVHAALTEQWGLVISEAAAAGLPLALSHMCGATPELLKPAQNGVQFDPQNHADIVSALIDIMSLNEENRKAYGKTSRDIVKNWGPERYTDGLITAAKAALQSHNGKPRRTALLDQYLMSFLSRRVINDVS